MRSRAEETSLSRTGGLMSRGRAAQAGLLPQAGLAQHARARHVSATHRLLLTSNPSPIPDMAPAPVLSPPRPAAPTSLRPRLSSWNFWDGHSRASKKRTVVASRAPRPQSRPQVASEARSVPVKLWPKPPVASTRSPPAVTHRRQPQPW